MWWGDKKFVRNGGFGSFGNHRSGLNNSLAIMDWESFHRKMEG
jgi:hypothetical protein